MLKYYLLPFLLFIVIAIHAIKHSDKRILIYGHRGARGLAPENTIPAYRVGLRIGVDYVDMDVGVTKDGVVVVTHDLALNPDLTRDSNDKWIDGKPVFIKNLTWQELQTYDVGELKPKTKYARDFPMQKAISGTHIPSLRDAIRFVNKAANNKIKFQIEIKNDPAHPEATFSPEYITKAVIKVLEEENIDGRTELQAFDWRILQLAQKLNPKIQTAYLTEQDLTKQMHEQEPKIAGRWTAGFLLKNYDNSVPKMIAELGGKVWGSESKELNKENVIEAHKYGLKIVTWTVNTKEEMQRAISLGVDGIITDRPDVLREVLATDRDNPKPESNPE